MANFNPKIELIKSSLIVLAIVVGLFLLASWLFANILVYLFISLVLATILRPLVNSLTRIQVLGIRMPRALAIILSFIVLFLVLTLFIVQFIPLVSDQIEVLASVDYETLYYQFTNPLTVFEEFLLRHGLTQREPGFMVDSIKGYMNEVFQEMDIQNVVNSVLALTGNIFIGFMAVFFITYFMLREKGLLRKNFISLIPNQYFEVSIAAIYKIEKLLSNYLLGLLFQMFFIFSLASLGLSILNINYALTIAVFAAVANLIPYAGPLLGAAFGIVVAVSTSPSLPEFNDYLFLVTKILAVFGVVQLTDNVLLQPLIFSKSVKAHPLEIFLVIFAGASLGGQMENVILGMVLAIPIYTVIRVSFLEFYKGYSQYKVFKTKS